MVVRNRSIVAGRLLCRGFSSCRATQQKQKSPQDILSQGFKQMESPKYTRSKENLEPLVRAGKQLGISESEISELYYNVQVGQKPFAEMAPEQKAELFNESAKGLEPPQLDEPFRYDDLPPLGHLQMHEHRVQREYVRIAAYDLPQLTKYIQPYKPYAKKKEIVKFKYTTYMGEEHAAERKVVATLKTAELDELSDAEKHKLRVLAGARYNAGTDELKISAARYPTQAQNKRFIGEVLRDLIAAARDQSDSMADVPLDTRHIEPKLRRNKPIYRDFPFPKEWARPEDAPKTSPDFMSKLSNAIEQ
ncbi:small ribosomal subunit protein mS35 [Trichomonascus vanleenenianus]|uniref:mitochondrial 37S ribosomal protein mS35 RSM24 n=1 Tax=Trichomonascus vanleenenianus TaxID=2268995 RepID=UPI003ECAE601